MLRLLFLFVTSIILVCDELPCVEKEANYEFVGFHMFGSYIGCDHDQLSNIEGLKAAMHEGVKASGATLLNTVYHVFPPDGLTMLMLLSESHASIHTYPEFNACFIDFFTCGTRCSSEKFDEVLREYLHPQEANIQLVYRAENSFLKK